MKKAVLFIFSFFIVVSVFSQDERATTNQKFISILSPTGGGFTFYMPDGIEYNKNRVDGSPYLFKQWQQGMVYFNQDAISSDYKLNYNSFLDQVEYLKDEEHLMITNKKDVEHIEIGSKDFYYSSFYDNDNKVINGYLDKLGDGKIILYKRYKCNLLKNSKNYTIASGDIVDKFDQDEYYYISKNNEPAIKIKKQKKKLLDLFDDNKKLIDEYINKINVRKEEDIIQLFEYYNSL